MSLPYFQDPAVALKVAGVLYAKELPVSVYKPAAPHYNMSPFIRINFTRNRVQGIGEQRVIRIQVTPDFASRHPESLVDRISLAPVWFRDNLEMTVWFQNLQGLIGRTAINYNMLKIWIILRQNALNCFSNEFPLVIRGGHN